MRLQDEFSPKMGEFSPKMRRVAQNALVYLEAKKNPGARKAAPGLGFSGECGIRTHVPVTR